MASMLTFCLLVKNEEENLRQLIPQLKRLGYEILAGDTGSVDGTRACLDAEKIRTVTLPWQNNFADTRNAMLGFVETKWVFMLDADERLTPELERELHGLLASETDRSGYLVPRKNYYLGSWLRYGGQYPDRQLKIFRRDSAVFEKNVHEKTVIRGKIGTLDGHLLHFSYRTVSQYLAKFNLYTGIEAELLRQRGIRPSFLNSIIWLSVKPVMRFCKRYFLKLGFLDGVPGLFAALFDVFGIMVRYYKLRELSAMSQK